MIKERVLENPKAENIFGQHVYPELEAGKIGMRSGFYMAATDEIFLTVKGKGGHAAIPDRLIDPVLISAHIILALQQIVSRNAAPTQPTVISFGKVLADGRTNVVPDEVKIEGIMRTFDENWREEVKHKVEQIAKNTARAMGGECEVFIDKGYPAVYNNPELTDRAHGYAIEFMGEENVVDLDMRMTAEDFSYYAQIIPGCFYRLGISNKSQGITSNLHTPTFDVDESSLETGMGLMAWITICELNKI
jgi:amidohydrolase